MILVLILLVVWLGVLVFLNSIKMHFFVFLIGSLGCFFFLMYLGTATIQGYMQELITYCLYLTGKLTGLFVAIPTYSMITCYYRNEVMSFYVDYECSGFVESIVYISLLLFYPIYNILEKAILSVVGIIYILLTNVLRVFIICLIVYFFGPNMFYFAHTIFARLLFFTLTVILYFLVFTKTHIKRQKVGNILYEQR